MCVKVNYYYYTVKAIMTVYFEMGFESVRWCDQPQHQLLFWPPV